MLSLCRENYDFSKKCTCHFFYSLGTPLCMDQFGWSEEKTVLYFGILIASLGLMSVFLFASVGPICKKIDERKILIFLGIFCMFLGRIALFPIPGYEPPANSTSNSDTTENLSLNPMLISARIESTATFLSCES